MSNLGEYKGKKLVSIESTKADQFKPAREGALGKEEMKSLMDWMKEMLSGRVSSIRVCHITSIPYLIMI
jgi:HSP90 family molecular chaperone